MSHCWVTVFNSSPDSYKQGKFMQKNLNQTGKLLANTEEEVKKCWYALKEKDFVISEQRKAGVHEDCLLHIVLIILVLIFV